MAFSPTNLISNHSCDRKKQRTNTPTPTPTPTPTLPSPEPDSEDYTDRESDRESINNAFQAIKARFYGLPTKPYPAFHFENPASFQSLQNQLNRFNSGCLSRFVADKVRFDWNASTGDLLLRLMPTSIHEHFQDAVADVLKAELRRIAKNPELAPFCEKITSYAHADITEGGASKFNKSPDGQFAFDNAENPPFILEVAYSEEEKAALNKTMEYFSVLPGCTVLSFDLNYAPPSKRIQGHKHTGTVSLVTSTVEYEDGIPCTVAEELVDAEVFRQASQTIEGEIGIPFKLFVPPEQREDLPESAGAASVRIDFADLAKFLAKGEEKQRQRDATSKPSRLPTKGIIWRKRDGKEVFYPSDERTPKRRLLSTATTPPRRSERRRSFGGRSTRD